MEAGSQLHLKPWHRKTPGRFAHSSLCPNWWQPCGQGCRAGSELSPALETHMGTGCQQAGQCEWPSAELQSAPAVVPTGGTWTQ